MKLVLLFLALFVLSSNAKKSDKAYKCDVCKAVVDEVEHDIGQVDPNKMIQVGSYRVDPNGKTRTVQKKYARSETHVSELLEGVCEKISQNYMEVKDKEAKGATRLKRLVTHDGKMSEDIDMKALMEESNKGDKPPGDKEKKIKFACDKLVEDFEDDFMDLFQTDHNRSVEDVCSEISGFCKKPSKKQEL